MSWGAWILVLVYPVTLLFALTALDAPGFARAERLAARVGLAGALTRVWAFALDRERALRSAMVFLGVALAVYTGVLLSTLGARALWSSALLAPLFLVSGVSTGAAFLMLFRVSDAERRSLVRADRAAMALELITIALLLVGLSTSGGAAGRSAADLLLGGRYTAQFWTLVMFAGILLPATLEVLGHRMRLPVTRIVPLLVLVGGLALRWILVGAGQA
jgi:formate-dependent nitrite reductase membrane component NrfD